MVFIFVLVAGGIFLYQNQKPETDVIEMKGATLPVVYIIYDGVGLNYLHGYIGEMDVSSMRDSLTPMKENRALTLQIADYGNIITEIIYEVRTLDQERLIEKTQVGAEDWIKNEDGIQVNLQLENLIEPNTEYSFTIRLSTSQQDSISYYTRVISGVNDIEEKLDFVTDFSQKTFDKEEAESLIPYLESNTQADNTNYGKVDIYSSFAQITWGDLAPEKVTEPVPVIKEINGDITSIELSYQIKAKNMYGTEEYYNVKEFYRTNYTETRTYLLTYERTMNQLFRSASENVSTSRINLGIASSSDIESMTTEKGEVTFFVKERELWAYHVKENEMKCIFSFIDKKEDGIRDAWNQHDIKIVQADVAGNIYFIVFGYMNRGIHEGKVGITLYHYTNEENTIEEVMFIPYQKSFAYLKKNLGDLFYINDSDNFYFLLEGNVFAVDLASLEYVLVVSDLQQGCYVINKKGNILAWQMENDMYESTRIKEIQLDTNKEFVISAKEGERIRVVGFVEDDLVYGTAKEEDIYTTIEGNIEFYMSDLTIVGTNSRQVGSYHKDTYYFTEADITENIITLTRFQKNQNGNFIPAEKDIITNNTAATQKELTLSFIATELKKKEIGLNLTANAGTGDYNTSYTKEVIYIDGKDLELLELNGNTYLYYIYGKGQLLDAVNNITEAIQQADAAAGAVLDSAGRYIWMRGGQKKEALISNISIIPSEENTIASALNGMLKYAGVTIDAIELLNSGKTSLEILNIALEGRGMDLTGCTLKQVLYFVSEGKPVLARMENNSYVLIIGYDSYNAILLNCRTNESYKIGLEDGTALFQAAGNRFLSYKEK